MDRVIHLDVGSVCMVEEALARQVRECIKNHLAWDKSHGALGYWLTRAKDWGQLLNKVRRQNP